MCACVGDGLWVEVYLWDFFSRLGSTTKAIPTLLRVTRIFLLPRFTVFFFRVARRMHKMCSARFHWQRAHDRIIWHANKEMQFLLNHSIVRFRAYILHGYGVCERSCHVPLPKNIRSSHWVAWSLAAPNTTNVGFNDAYEMRSGKKKQNLNWSENTQVSHYKSIKYFQVFHSRPSERTQKRIKHNNIWIVSAACRSFIWPLF